MMFTIEVKTTGKQEIVDVTGRVAEQVDASGVTEGVCHLFVPHTTAGISINENADPDVKRDILMAMDKLVTDDPDFRHLEGNSAAHIKTMLTGSSLTLIIHRGDLELGNWGGIYFCEYDGPRRRRLLGKVIG